MQEKLTVFGADITDEKQRSNNDKDVYKWQQKLMPWMILMPTLLIGIFILLATLQMRHFEGFIYHGDRSEIDAAFPNVARVEVDSSIQTKLGYIKLYTLAKMEEHSIDRRYNQAGAVMMAGIFTKYLGFFTGMILAIVGAVFIISKLKEDVSNLEGSVKEQINFKIISSSPGIIFGLLGTILMIVAILKKAEVNVHDMPLYLNYYNTTKTGLDENAIDELNTTVDSLQQHIDSAKAANAKP
jgi:uncharacterized Tic20 family protein